MLPGGLEEDARGQKSASTSSPQAGGPNTRRGRRGSHVGRRHALQSVKLGQHLQGSERRARRTTRSADGSTSSTPARCLAVRAEGPACIGRIPVGCATSPAVRAMPFGHRKNGNSKTRRTGLNTLERAQCLHFRRVPTSPNGGQGSPRAYVFPQEVTGESAEKALPTADGDGLCNGGSPAKVSPSQLPHGSAIGRRAPLQDYSTTIRDHGATKSACESTETRHRTCCDKHCGTTNPSRRQLAPRAADSTSKHNFHTRSTLS